MTAIWNELLLLKEAQVGTLKALQRIEGQVDNVTDQNALVSADLSQVLAAIARVEFEQQEQIAAFDYLEQRFKRLENSVAAIGRSSEALGSMSRTQTAELSDHDALIEGANISETRMMLDRIVEMADYLDMVDAKLDELLAREHH